MTTARLSDRTSRVRGSAIRDLLTLTARDDVVSLAGGLPSPDVMPLDRIREATIRAFDHPGGLQYAETTGVRALREVIADRESRRAGRAVDVQQVLVTHGSQQALTLLASVLLDPGDVVVVDSPAYTGALQVFQAADADIVAIPIDDRGTDTRALEQLLHDGLRPRVVHTVSNFHNPRGVTLTADRRRHLARLAEQYDFWIVEDDPYGEIWFDTPPPAPIDSPFAIRLGSVSKILAPALRVGWVIAPERVRAAVELMKQGADLCGSTLTHLATAELLADTPWLEGHLERVRTAYRTRASALCDALDDEFGSLIRFERASGGMFVWFDFTDGTDTTALLPVAVDHGVGYVPGAAFGDEWGASARVCFTTLDESVLRDAVHRLRQAHDLRPSRVS